MTDLSNITKPDISDLKKGDEILIRAIVFNEKNASSGIVVKSMASSEYVKDTYFWVDSNCYFGKVEQDIPISVGDKFRQPDGEICEVIGIGGNVYWLRFDKGGRCVLTETLKGYERMPK